MLTDNAAIFAFMAFCFIISFPLILTIILLVVDCFRKQTYKVVYRRYGFYISTTITTYIKARSIVDVQAKLEKKEYPCSVVINSIERI